jgi:hypothetical protein
MQNRRLKRIGEHWREYLAVDGDQQEPQDYVHCSRIPPRSETIILVDGSSLQKPSMGGDQRGPDQHQDWEFPLVNLYCTELWETGWSRARAGLGHWGRLHVYRSRRRESKGFKSAFTQAFTGCFGLRAARTINSPWLGVGTTALEAGIGDRRV